LIGVKTITGVEYITKIEHFRGLMPDETYEGLIEWIDKEGIKYEDIIDDLKYDLSSAQENAADYELKCDELEEAANKTRKLVQVWCDEIETIIKNNLGDDVKNKVIE
jgi:hypothetical protein